MHEVEAKGKYPVCNVVLPDENGDYIVTKTGDNLYSCQSSQGSVLHGPVAIYA